MLTTILVKQYFRRSFTPIFRKPHIISSGRSCFCSLYSGDIRLSTDCSHVRRRQWIIPVLYNFHFPLYMLQTNVNVVSTTNKIRDWYFDKSAIHKFTHLLRKLLKRCLNDLAVDKFEQPAKWQQCTWILVKNSIIRISDGYLQNYPKYEHHKHVMRLS